MVYESGRYQMIENRFHTGQAFLLPEADAVLLAMAVYYPNKGVIMEAAEAQGEDARRRMAAILIHEIRRDPRQLDLWKRKG